MPIPLIGRLEDAQNLIGNAQKNDKLGRAIVPRAYRYYRLTSSNLEIFR